MMEQPTNGQPRDSAAHTPLNSLEVMLSKEQERRDAAEQLLEAYRTDRRDFLEWLLAVIWHPSLVDQQKLDDVEELIEKKIAEIKGSANGKPR